MSERHGALYEKTVPGLHGYLITRLPRVDKEASVLDVGCGPGAWLERLAEAGFTDLFGCDLDVSQYSGRAAECIAYNLDADLDLFEGRSFGLITAIEVIEHLENPGRLLSLVERCLARDGYFVMTTPNVHSMQARLKFLVTGRMKFFDTNSDPTHLMPMLMQTLPKMLSNHGLVIEDMFCYPSVGRSRMTSSYVRAAAGLLSLVLTNDWAGDVLGFIVRRVKRDGGR